MIILDTYDISTLNPSIPSYADLSHSLYLYKNPNLSNPGGNFFENLPYKLHRFCPYNGAVSDTQLAWLQDTLTRAKELRERCFVFGHIPLKLEASSDSCILWNAEEVHGLLKSSGCVVAYIAGHDHSGGYARDNAGIYHITPPAPLECTVGQPAFGSMRVYPDRCELLWQGKGAEWLPRVMKFRDVVKKSARSSSVKRKTE